MRLEVLAELIRPGHYLLRNPLARPDGFFLTRVGTRASCHALIPITVELMLPVTYTQEAYATCHVYGHRQPIILASAYSPTYPSSDSTALPYGISTFIRGAIRSLPSTRHVLTVLTSAKALLTSGGNLSAHHLGLTRASGGSLLSSRIPAHGRGEAPMTRALRPLFETNRKPRPRVHTYVRTRYLTS